MHSDSFALEKEHLYKTHQHIQREKNVTTPQHEKAKKALEELSRQSGGNWMDELFIARTLEQHYRQTLHNLTLAGRTPYFTRVDFLPADAQEAETWYIGKYGVEDSVNHEPAVVDWRSPVANLYYSGQIGPMRYDAPDGSIAGDLQIKRQIIIKDGELESILDTDIVSQEEFLHAALAGHADDRLRDIVTTIQREQNDVIRAGIERPIVVQGVAGSGKTTLALHRIAYLLYTYRDSLLPENLMILAPNRMFLDYISHVLPELGVEDVLQMTFEQLCQQLCACKLRIEPAHAKIEQIIANPEDDHVQQVAKIARYKGSAACGKALERFIQAYQEQLIPNQTLRVGPAELMTHEQSRQILLVELAPFPLQRRIQEYKKYLKRRVEDAGERMVALLESECVRRARIVRERMPAGQARQDYLTRIYSARDQKKEKIFQQVRDFDYASNLPKINLMAVYKQFFAQHGSWWQGDPEWIAAVCQHSQQMLRRGMLEQEDLPLIVLLSKRLFGLPDLPPARHVVIDEAQDYTPMQFCMLSLCFPHNSYTIVGDLSQGIGNYRTAASWQESLEGVFGRDPAYVSLQTSYRSTVEIVTFANGFAMRHPFLGQQPAQPVLRHGAPPQICLMEDAQQLNRAILDWIHGQLGDGLKTVAVIAKTPQHCQALYAFLCGQMEVRLLTGEEHSYSAGVLILPAALSKGLEFDAVVLVDGGISSFGDTPLDARLYYVSLTRALHRLMVAALTGYTPLLDAVMAGNDRLISA